MENFQLTLLFKIMGFGSASGLVYEDDKLFIISDSSAYLYEYQMLDKKLEKIALTENAQDSIPKKDKLDLEAITRKGNDLVLLGSGSTDKRNRLFTYNRQTKKISESDFTAMYEKIKSQLQIKDDELNIEGLVITDKAHYFFQRGNGITSKNGIICVEEKASKQLFRFMPYELTTIKNVAATFTDAVLVDDKLYFLACAEDTNSTFHDGAIMGSIVGSIDLHSMKLEFTQQISYIHKFEGITLYKKSKSEITFLLCEDNDTDVLESDIYRLTLKVV